MAKWRQTLEERIELYPDGELGANIVRAELQRVAQQVQGMDAEEITMRHHTADKVAFCHGVQTAIDDVLALLKDAAK